MIKFRDCGHLVFRGASAFFRSALKSKGGGGTSILEKAEPKTAELLFCIVISVNQLSVYGAVADGCQELAQRSQIILLSTGNPVAKVNNDSESQIPSADVSNLTKSPVFNLGARANSMQQYDEDFENLPEDLRLAEACDDAGFS